MTVSEFFRSRTRKLTVILLDFIFFLLSDIVYLFCSQNLHHDIIDTSDFIVLSVILAVSMFSVRVAMRIYKSIWRYSNTNAYLKMVFSDVIGGLAAFCISIIYKYAGGRDFHLDHTLVVMTVIGTMFALSTLSTRFVYRFMYSRANKNVADQSQKISVAIVGAGQIGALLAEDLNVNKNSKYNPLFFIDTDGAKNGNLIGNLKIYPQDENTVSLLKSHGVSEIFIAVGNLDSEKANELYNFYKESGCKIKLYDSSAKDYMSGEENGKKTIREFQIEDLLFRKPMKLSDPTVKGYYNDKVVLVTGGGGSIGSELCRQVAKCSPKKLIILDIYENNAYDIQQELTRKYGDALDLSVEIASVRDRERLDTVFAAYRPNVVFHAAAHKHVPLMEHSSCEAIKNNVFGTYNTADMAEKYGVEKFILVSTDKAVNPTNVMGASKRMCEMIVRCRRDSKTSFSAVRFGNVLGSNGSVIPLFKQQIANGGPITITDRRIIRYFMTIPEASQLVMRAGAMAHRGELFVLDMGKPVKIYDLAVNMIRLSGLEVDRDIKIEEVGLRPGEKLYEELLIKTDTLTKTDSNMIFIEQETPFTREEVEDKLAVLSEALEETKHDLNSPKIKEALKKVVPTFVEPGAINKNAESSDEMQAVK